jgi:NAD(P)-dependent dehydrogenase (short-subunit alcohol dehydrogenase family)
LPVATGTFAPIAASTLAGLKEQFATNVEGVYLGTRYGAEAMKNTTTGGSIVNISTIAANMVLPYTSFYSSSKAAVEHFTRIAALEYSANKIRINAVSPGQTFTEGFEKLIANVPNKEEYLKEKAKKLPFGEFLQPEDIANAIVFLSGAEAKFITGVTLAVDGGNQLLFQGL